jgi:hypothetical protein
VTEDSVFVGAIGVADYMVDLQGGFFAIDRASGEARWQLNSEPKEGLKIWRFTAAPVAGRRLVLAGGLDGKVYAFESEV